MSHSRYDGLHALADLRFQWGGLMPALCCRRLALGHNRDIRTFLHHIPSQGNPSKLAFVAAARSRVVILNGKLRDKNLQKNQTPAWQPTQLLHGRHHPGRTAAIM
jgi:hypothetical protein